MKRKDYQQPTTMIVKLQQRRQLLSGSGTQGVRSGYGTANSDANISASEKNSDGEWEWN